MSLLLRGIIMMSESVTVQTAVTVAPSGRPGLLLRRAGQGPMHDPSLRLSLRLTVCVTVKPIHAGRPLGQPVTTPVTLTRKHWHWQGHSDRNSDCQPDSEAAERAELPP
jgi:hypothetical protein